MRAHKGGKDVKCRVSSDNFFAILNINFEMRVEMSDVKQFRARHGHEDSSMSSRTRTRTFKIHEDEDKDEDRLLK